MSLLSAEVFVRGSITIAFASPSMKLEEHVKWTYARDRRES